MVGVSVSSDPVGEGAGLPMLEHHLTEPGERLLRRVGLALEVREPLVEQLVELKAQVVERVDAVRVVLPPPELSVVPTRGFTDGL